MATFSHHHLLLIFSLLTVTSAAPSFRPKALVLPVSKDPSTLQYTINLTQRTPPVSVPVTLHLGGPFLWVDCDRNYVSSTYRPARCNSAQCSLADSKSCGSCNSPPRPGCNKNTCGLSPENPFTNTATSGELATDVVRINSTDGANLGRVVTTPNFLFSCAPTFLLKGLAKGAQGVAGFGRTKISIPSQLTSAFNLPKKFAICLASSVSDEGVIFFGDGPYTLYPAPVVTAASLSYTPLLVNPSSTSDYYIGVTSIKIENTSVPINKALLLINKGKGGTKISTVHPYTIMESSIFNAVSSYFHKELKKEYMKYDGYNATIVKAVAPFKLCYDRSTLLITRPGVEVPTIKLVLQSEKVEWAINGWNSMVTVKDNVMCFAFVDGGKNTETSIILGGYQLEDNIVQFDLAKSRLAFHSFYLESRCSNFNFTIA
ncbi:basic 7S globulin-like [Chenopodium quinoa]|uniref:basic 7S globulin-like n=1 Tax=Chenopodium quinoa TaxID=63459 RepID=UPI000B792296|nr:basic 7S globulin-like [Chenopodium quinoa]